MGEKSSTLVLSIPNAFCMNDAELFEAEVKASTLENKRDKEGLIIDLFRTLEASRRKNNI